MTVGLFYPVVDWIQAMGTKIDHQAVRKLWTDKWDDPPGESSVGFANPK